MLCRAFSPTLINWKHLQSPAGASSLAEIATLLSYKGQLCSRKGLILSKLENLVTRLQSLVLASSFRIQRQHSAEVVAKELWLTAEGQHAMLIKTADDSQQDVNSALKRATGLSAMVRDRRAG